MENTREDIANILKDIQQQFEVYVPRTQSVEQVEENFRSQIDALIKNTIGSHMEVDVSYNRKTGIINVSILEQPPIRHLDISVDCSDKRIEEVGYELV